MGYERINIYRATCDKMLKTDCQLSGPDAKTIDRALTNACEEGWKRIGNSREMICPQCLFHVQTSKPIVMLKSWR